MAVQPVTESYSIPGLEPRPLTQSAAEQRLTNLRRQLNDAAEHTFEASFLLLRQSNSLDAIPTQDDICDARVVAIEALSQRLAHIKTIGEGIQIGHEIARHCAAFFEADRPRDEHVGLVTVCNVEARTEVRAVTQVFDGGLQRRPRRSQQPKGSRQP